MINPPPAHQAPASKPTAIKSPPVISAPLPPPPPAPTVTPAIKPPSSVTPPAVTPPPSTVVVRPFVLKPPLNSLVDEAQALAQAGHLDAAAATLDRAVRIDPKNALLWIELAKLRLSENDPAQAEALARKAIALAHHDPAAQEAAKTVLEDALKLAHP